MFDAYRIQTIERKSLNEIRELVVNISQQLNDPNVGSMRKSKRLTTNQKIRK